MIDLYLQKASEQIDVGGVFERIIDWMTIHLDFLFDGISTGVEGVLGFFSSILHFPSPEIMVIILALIALKAAGRGVAIFTFLGMLLISVMGFWVQTMDTLSLVIASVLIALILGIPLGIWGAKSRTVEQVLRPILDFMQTLPAFVYLIPAVTFFSLGEVPGVIATLIFSIPPVVRLTNLGIRQVPQDIREAAIAFGSSPRQVLFKAELPVALPTIMAGVNQTIMLALSMVVIAGMIGAGGLGNEVLKGITQLKIDLGFEARRNERT
jgi:glycine betaine/proline transport system permease protein